LDVLNNRTLLGRLILATVEKTARSFSRLESLLFGDEPPQHPPVFIVGLPRSGTTLLYQTMCHCFRLAYTPTITNYLPFAPALATWIGKLWQPEYESDFKSHYGTVSGLASPGEGTMWNVWFEKDRHYRHAGELEAHKAREIIRLVGRIERISGGPFINKNLRNENRLPVLASLLPRAVFLVVLRSPRDVAISILRGRIEMQGDPELWFSVKPRSRETKSIPTPERQIVAQIKGLIEDLRQDIGQIGSERFVAVRYEDLCDSPRAVMKELSDFLTDRDVPIELASEPPERFQPSRGHADKLSPGQVASLERLLAESFPEDPYADLHCSWIRPAV
jgi:hypothetical protein